MKFALDWWVQGKNQSVVATWFLPNNVSRCEAEAYSLIFYFVRLSLNLAE